MIRFSQCKWFLDDDDDVGFLACLDMSATSNI